MGNIGGTIWMLVRFFVGTIAAELVFVIHAADKRENFWCRFFIGVVVCVLFSATHFPAQAVVKLFNKDSMTAISSAILWVWWLLYSVVTMGFIIFCFKLSVCNGMFRCILGLSVQQIITVVLQNIVCEMIYPGLANNSPFLYAVIAVITYTLFYILAYFLIARRMQDMFRVIIKDSKKTFLVYSIIIILLSTSTDLTTYVYYRASYTEYFHEPVDYLIKTVLPGYCIGVMIVICIVIILNLYSGYEMSSLQQEKEFLAQFQKEKELQYEYSKENIGLINQKCHDLKKQILALKLATDEERDALIDETDKAVQFYDAVVKTGNDTVNTILTEKSMYCASHNIRLSCNINMENMGNMDFIQVIDLYTLLGNALDNAIECVSKYDEEDKKVISLLIFEKGQMLDIFIDNYYDGQMNLVNGYPVTSKADRNYHGYGVKSIHMLAQKYKGDINISLENNSFSLQIMIPVPR